MQTFENEFVVAFDVDDTLVIWGDFYGVPHEGAVPFICPYSGGTNYLIPHKKHIQLLKQYTGRGMCVMVWSAGGTQWAKSVINTLGLEDYVDLIITKPSKLIDDLPLNEIFPKPIYLKS